MYDFKMSLKIKNKKKSSFRKWGKTWMKVMGS